MEQSTTVRMTEPAPRQGDVASRGATIPESVRGAACQTPRCIVDLPFSMPDTETLADALGRVYR